MNGIGWSLAAASLEPANAITKDISAASKENYVSCQERRKLITSRLPRCRRRLSRLWNCLSRLHSILLLSIVVQTTLPPSGQIIYAEARAPDMCDAPCEWVYSL